MKQNIIYSTHCIWNLKNWKHLGGEVPWIFTEPKTCYRKIVFQKKKKQWPHSQRRIRYIYLGYYVNVKFEKVPFSWFLLWNVNPVAIVIPVTIGVPVRGHFVPVSVVSVFPVTIGLPARWAVPVQWKSKDSTSLLSTHYIKGKSYFLN